MNLKHESIVPNSSTQMTFDVAIVGAGIVGAACAASLSSAGLSVLVIDSNDVASGSTAAGMGHIVVMDDSEAQFALTNYSRKLWNDLAPELPASSEYEHCGTIWVRRMKTKCRRSAGKKISTKRTA